MNTLKYAEILVKKPDLITYNMDNDKSAFAICVITTSKTD